MNTTRRIFVTRAIVWLNVLAAVFLIKDSVGQCTRTIVGPTVANIVVAAGETVCINSDLVVTTDITIASGGRLTVAPRVRILTENVYSYGALDLGDNSYLDVQSGANFESAGSITTMGNSATVFVCNGLNVVFGATILMGPLSVFDSFNTTLAFSSNYLQYTGAPGANPQAQFVARNSMIVNGFISNSSMVGYCGTSAGTNLTPAQLGAAQNYCTPLIPPAIMAAMHCNVIAPYYFAAALPVRFEYLNVYAIGNVNRIHWAIEEDQTVEYYEVQRRGSDSLYHPLYKIYPEGHHQQLQVYSYTDTFFSYEVKQLYYRIQAVRKNGSSFYSMVRRVNTNYDISTMRVIPNPVANAMHISLPANYTRSPNLKLQLVNCAGKTLFSQEVSGRRMLIAVPPQVIAQLPKGYYYAKLISDAGVKVSSFVKL